VQILHLLRQLPAECLVQQRLFEVVEDGEFLAADGFEALIFFTNSVWLFSDCLLFLKCRWQENGQRTSFRFIDDRKSSLSRTMNHTVLKPFGNHVMLNEFFQWKDVIH